MITDKDINEQVAAAAKEFLLSRGTTHPDITILGSPITVADLSALLRATGVSWLGPGRIGEWNVWLVGPDIVQARAVGNGISATVEISVEIEGIILSDCCIEDFDQPATFWHSYTPDPVP